MSCAEFIEFELNVKGMTVGRKQNMDKCYQNY